MRRRTAAIIVATGSVVTVAVGSGLAASANWSVGSTSAMATTDGATLPRVPAPQATVTRSGPPAVSWTAVRFRSGAPVGGYAVFRHAGRVTTEVCRVPATMLTCTDATAKAGSEVAYSVRATAGDRWTGPAGRISDPVTVPERSRVGPEAVKPAVDDTGAAPAGSPTATPREENGIGDGGSGTGGGTEPGNRSGGPVAGPPATPAPSVVPTSASPSPAATVVDPQAG